VIESGIHLYQTEVLGVVLDHLAIFDASGIESATQPLP